MKVLKAVCLAGAAAFALTSFGEEVSWQRPRTTRRYLHPPSFHSVNMFCASGGCRYRRVVRGRCHEDSSANDDNANAAAPARQTTFKTFI